jgi:hypothetical protein
MCMVGTKGPNAKTYRAFARRPVLWCCKTANATISMQNVARFVRNGKSKHTKICLSVVHTWNVRYILLT